MTLAEIFSRQYLFDPIPSADNKYFWYQLAFFSLLIVGAIVIILLKKIDRKIRLNQFYAYLTCGILGMIYIFARHEKLPWLSSYFYISLVVTTLIIWIIILTIWIFRYSLKLKKQKIYHERYEKYLPKKK